MPSKKKNHTVQESLIKNWLTEKPNGESGVFVYDATKGRSYFSRYGGKSRFSFASRKDLYVLEYDGQRRTELEDWFAGLESTFIKGIKRFLQHEEQAIFQHQEELDKFILALVGYRHRDQLSLSKNLELIKSDHSIRERLTENRNLSDKQILLENTVNAINASAVDFGNRIHIVHIRSRDEEFILGDRSYLEDIVDDFSFFTISPNSAIAFKPTQESSYYETIECDASLVKSINQAIAANSVSWIVSSKEELTTRYQPDMNNLGENDSVFIENKLPIKGLRYK
ncbi:MAG TPA: DUF4238 domain-containing protein [Saprospiraceae bacterium]|nr:DUF4238 domain-containing protein [Saprospiraceae bacterium]HMQ85217.1 DUF4238 domain-containing protein [Saprospiraceae bacterium]